MSNNNDGSEFLKGFLFGGLVGAVAALLYAPKSGKEVREDLRKMSAELKDDAETKLQLAQTRADALLAETKQKLEELRREAESAVAEIKKNAMETVAEGKGAVEKQRDRLKDALDAGVAAFKEEKQTKRKKAS
ncbi:MAG: gas vesicle protein [Calditrichaeota bacterium]|nr:MAG: gas vesicle protein [Calditrichota bacterium]